MEKNVTIIDEDGVVIGYTYPKRAKGLVKKGRAEPVSENIIRITDTQVPTVDTDTEVRSLMKESQTAICDAVGTSQMCTHAYGEVRNMSKVIGFEARKFGIDPTCTGNNIANRMFVTDALGNNVEVYEIGDYGHNWTQISYEMPVEKDTDFEFLFAMTGDIDGAPSDSAKCNFIVMPIHEKAKVKSIPKFDSEGKTSGEDGASDASLSSEQNSLEVEDPGKDDWENRYQYCLLHREYRPTMEKVWNGSSIRFYKIPFNTGDADKIKFVFVAFQRPYKIFPVKNFEEYSNLPDFNQQGNNDWFGKKRGFGNSFGGSRPYGWYSGPKGFTEAEKSAAENFFNNIGMMVSNAVKEAMESFDKFQKGNFKNWDNKNSRQNKNPYSGDGYHATNETEGKKTSSKAQRNQRTMDTYVLAQLLGKIEDDGDLDLNGYYIEDCEEANLSDINIETADNISVSIDNASISGDAFNAIMKKVGDNSDISGNNMIIGTAKSAPEEIGGFGSTSDNNSWSFVNATMSEAAFAILLSKIGDNCDVDLTNSEINDFNEIKELDGFCNSFDNTTIKMDNTRISKRLYHMLVRCCGEDSEIEGNAVIW